MTRLKERSLLGGTGLYQVRGMDNEGAVCRGRVMCVYAENGRVLCLLGEDNAVGSAAGGITVHLIGRRSTSQLEGKGQNQLKPLEISEKSLWMRFPQPKVAVTRIIDLSQKRAPQIRNKL